MDAWDEELSIRRLWLFPQFDNLAQDVMLCGTVEENAHETLQSCISDLTS